MDRGSDELRIALASLLKMINLMGAELLVGKRRLDIDVFERCVREKLFANIEGVSPESTASGVALAHTLVEPVLQELRKRVNKMHREQGVAFMEEPSPQHRYN